MDQEIRDYASRVGDRSSRKYGTFSYLPEMDAASIRRQIEHMLAKGWNCAVEHVEPSRATGDYWYMWKLPMFGERDADKIMNTLTACRNENGQHCIRLIGYDNTKQTQGLAMVVHRG